MRRAALWWSGARLAKESLENENYSKQNRTYRKGKRATEKAKDSFTSSKCLFHPANSGKSKDTFRKQQVRHEQLVGDFKLEGAECVSFSTFFQTPREILGKRDQTFTKRFFVPILTVSRV